MGLNEVLEEIRPGCTKRRYLKDGRANASSKACPEVGLDSQNEDSSISSQIEDAERKCAEPRKIRARRRTTAPQKRSNYGDSLYTSIIIGDINIDGMDLMPGEKLVIAKLTPIVMSR